VSSLKNVDRHMVNLLEIRKKSQDTVKHLGGSINEALPLLDNVEYLREAESVMDRCLALFAVVAHSYGFPSEKAKNWLVKENILEVLSPNERNFLENGIGDSNVFKGNVECLWALTWALSIHSNLDFSVLCSNDFIGLFPNLKCEESAKKFRAKARLRPLEEIVHQADLAYCLHWALMQLSVENNNTSEFLPIYAITNRRKALDWLICDQAWDEIPLDT